jgi:CrcB protein
MKTALLVGVGGFLGSIGRHLIGVSVPPNLGGLPFPTMVVNVIGSLLIGALAGLGESRLGTEAWSFAVIGCLGGFTTFSALSLETLTLMRAGHAGIAALGVLLQVGVGLAAAWLGYFSLR